MCLVAGLLSTTRSLDREKTAGYNITVLVEDRGFPSKTSTATVSIKVIDINDTPPRFSSNQVSAAISEGGAGRSIVSLTASDPDLHTNLKYHINWDLSWGKDENSQFVNLSVLQGSFSSFGGSALRVGTGRLDRETLETAFIVFEVEDLNTAENARKDSGLYQITFENVIIYDDANISKILRHIFFY